MSQGSDDSKLLSRARSGDGDAYRLLVERYERRVFHLAYSLVKSREDAADIAQDAFVKAYQSLANFKGEATFYTWLYRITNNLAIDLLRRRRPGESFDSDEAAQEDPADVQPGTGVLGSRLGTNPQRSALRRELAEKMEEALEQLPEKHRAILLLREVAGLSYEELSETLGIPKGTVMSRLFHARSKMQEILAVYLEGDAPAAAVNEDE
ncbi:MAG: RNA polymerase sigma factor [Myxococcales bacterium]